MTTSTSSYQRTQRARVNEAYGHRQVELSPDHRPAVRLRRELQRDRALGLDFDDVFDEEVELALHDPESEWAQRDLEQWRTVFLGGREIWRAAFDRTGGMITPLRPSLLG